MVLLATELSFQWQEVPSITQSILYNTAPRKKYSLLHLLFGFGSWSHNCWHCHCQWWVKLCVVLALKKEPLALLKLMSFSLSSMSLKYLFGDCHVTLPQTKGRPWQTRMERECELFGSQSKNCRDESGECTQKAVRWKIHQWVCAWCRRRGLGRMQ